jgi:hypothetical protein
MNQEQKDRWVAALRSGEFKQGQKVLAYYERADDGTVQIRNCCMGVGLCVLPEEGTYWKQPGLKTMPIDGCISLFTDDVMIATTMPPKSWQKFAGLDRPVGREALEYIRVNISEHNLLGLMDWVIVLTTLNDRLNATFYQIADVIERFLPVDGFLPVDEDEAIVDETIRS